MKPAARQAVTIKDRTIKKTFLDHFLKEVYSFAETAFFIGCGAIMITLEGLGKLLKTGYEKKAKDRCAPQTPLAIPGRPDTIKIPMLPIDDYTRLDADQIIRLLRRLSADQLRLLQDFESSHKDRKSVLKAIDRILEKSGP